MQKNLLAVSMICLNKCIGYILKGYNKRLNDRRVSLQSPKINLAPRVSWTVHCLVMAAVQGVRRSAPSGAGVDEGAGGGQEANLQGRPPRGNKWGQVSTDGHGASPNGSGRKHPPACHWGRSTAPASGLQGQGPLQVGSRHLSVLLWRGGGGWGWVCNLSPWICDMEQSLILEFYSFATSNSKHFVDLKTCMS